MSSAKAIDMDAIAITHKVALPIRQLFEDSICSKLHDITL
jgi:hypothetical protein